MTLKRCFDFSIALIAIILASPILLGLAFAVKASSPGPILYWSKRIGQYNHIFNMPKFRSMKIDTPVVATHLLNNPDQFLTPIGAWLRKTSLDELPQLWCILIGSMSIVGPRPALFNQDDLVQLRTQHGVDILRPGLTGWAQINGRDEIPIPQKVALDTYYLKHQSFKFDCQIIWKTALKVVRSENVSH